MELDVQNKPPPYVKVLDAVHAAANVVLNAKEDVNMHADVHPEKCGADEAVRPFFNPLIPPCDSGIHHTHGMTVQ